MSTRSQGSLIQKTTRIHVILVQVKIVPGWFVAMKVHVQELRIWVVSAASAWVVVDISY